MATTLNLTTSYVGEAATELINRMFWAAKTIQNNWVTIKPDVNKSWKIRRLAATGIIAAPTCDFTPAGTVNIDERDLDVAPFEVNLQLCKADFKHVDWSSVRMGTGMNRQLSQDVVDAMIDEILLHVGEEIEFLIWRGDTGAGSYNLFDGFYKKMVADVPAGNKGTPAAIDASNVMAKLGEIYDLVAVSSVIDAPDLSWYVSTNVAAAYRIALANAGYLNQYEVGEKPLNYLGYELYSVPGLESDVIIAAAKSNLYFGTESVNNFNEVTLKDMADVDLSDNVRFRSYAVGGVEFGWPDEIFMLPRI